MVHHLAVAADRTHCTLYCTTIHPSPHIHACAHCNITDLLQQKEHGLQTFSTRRKPLDRRWTLSQRMRTLIPRTRMTCSIKCFRPSEQLMPRRIPRCHHHPHRCSHPRRRLDHQHWQLRSCRLPHPVQHPHHSTIGCQSFSQNTTLA